MNSFIDFNSVHTNCINNNIFVLSEIESKSILSKYGIPIPKGELVRNHNEVLEKSALLTFPVVAKISAQGLLHKTEYGGIITNINNKEELIIAFNNLNEKVTNQNIKGYNGILVEEQCYGQVEIIAGFSNDTVFGPVLMAGIGGIYTNLLNDVSFCILPATEKEIFNMLKKLKGYPLIEGYRGKRKIYFKRHTYFYTD